MRPTTVSDRTSITATESSGVHATYARAPSGWITIPAAPCPTGTRFTTLPVTKAPALVRAPLPGPDSPVPRARRGVVAPDPLAPLGREPDLPAGHREPVRTRERAQVDDGQGLLPHQVDGRERVVRARTVVRDVCYPPIRCGDHLVRIRPHRHARHHRERRRVDDCQGLVRFAQDEQGARRRGTGPGRWLLLEGERRGEQQYRAERDAAWVPEHGHPR